MKIINSIMNLLKNEAFNGVSALIAVLLILISPDHRITLGILAALLFILVVIGHFFENSSAATNSESLNNNRTPVNIAFVTKKALPIVSAVLVVVSLVVITTSLFDKSTKFHFILFGGGVDKLSVPYRDTPISLLAITPKGMLHDVFEKSEPVIFFDEDDVTTMAFKRIEYKGDYPFGIYVENGGQDRGNIVYEPANNFTLAYSYEKGYALYSVKQFDTIFLQLLDDTYARIHFNEYIYDAYGNLVSVELYVSYLKNGQKHFEKITHP